MTTASYEILADSYGADARCGAPRTGTYRSAPGSRDIIGQAKGASMERFDIDALAAFALLDPVVGGTRTRPVVVVAEELLETKTSTDR